MQLVCVREREIFYLTTVLTAIITYYRCQVNEIGRLNAVGKITTGENSEKPLTVSFYPSHGLVQAQSWFFTMGDRWRVGIFVNDTLLWLQQFFVFIVISGKVVNIIVFSTRNGTARTCDASDTCNKERTQSPCRQLYLLNVETSLYASNYAPH